MLAWTGDPTWPISSDGGHHVRRHGGGQAAAVSARAERLTNRNHKIKQNQ
jgi:hypothetical protein